MHTEFQLTWNSFGCLHKSCMKTFITLLHISFTSVISLIFPSLIMSSALLPLHLSFVFFIFVPFSFIPLAFWSCCQRVRTDSGGTEKAFKFLKTEGNEEISHIHNDRFHSYSGTSGWTQLIFFNYKEIKVSSLEWFGTSENIPPFKQEM